MTTILEMHVYDILQALNILAMNLSLPPDAVPLSKSFFELGGNSVSMIAAIVQLRQHSLHIDIDRFVRASSIRDVIDHVVTDVPTPASIATCPRSSDAFDIVPLSDVRSQGEVLVNMWAECYSLKNPLYTLIGVQKNDAVPAARHVFEAAVEVCHHRLILYQILFLIVFECYCVRWTHSTYINVYSSC